MHFILARQTLVLFVVTLGTITDLRHLQLHAAAAPVQVVRVLDGTVSVVLLDHCHVRHVVKLENDFVRQGVVRFPAFTTEPSTFPTRTLSSDASHDEDRHNGENKASEEAKERNDHDVQRAVIIVTTLLRLRTTTAHIAVWRYVRIVRSSGSRVGRNGIAASTAAVTTVATTATAAVTTVATTARRRWSH